MMTMVMVVVVVMITRKTQSLLEYTATLEFMGHI